MNDKCAGVWLHPDTLTVMLSDNLSSINVTRKLTERQCVFAWLLDFGRIATKVTRIEAEAIGTHYLYSTVSDFQKYHRMYLERDRTKHPGRFGVIHLCQYGFEPLQPKKVELFLHEVLNRRATK